MSLNDGCKHVGDYIMFAWCRKCGQEWVHVSSGIPPTMTYCKHGEEDAEYAHFTRTSKAKEMIRSVVE